MKLLTSEIRNQLLRNGRLTQQFAEDGTIGSKQQGCVNHGAHAASPLRARNAEPDFIPVVKLFTPDAGCTWLLTELDPDDPDIAFGLCDLGMGFPELGSVRISELESVRGRLGLPVERDLHFAPMKTLSAYADEARERGSIQA